MRSTHFPARLIRFGSIVSPISPEVPLDESIQKSPKHKCKNRLEIRQFVSCTDRQPWPQRSEITECRSSLQEPLQTRFLTAKKLLHFIKPVSYAERNIGIPARAHRSIGIPVCAQRNTGIPACVPCSSKYDQSISSTLSRRKRLDWPFIDSASPIVTISYPSSEMISTPDAPSSSKEPVPSADAMIVHSARSEEASTNKRDLRHRHFGETEASPP